MNRNAKKICLSSMATRIIYEKPAKQYKKRVRKLIKQMTKSLKRYYLFISVNIHHFPAKRNFLQDIFACRAFHEFSCKNRH